MSDQSTCWTMIRDAAAGDAEARDRFARLYAPAVRAYLRARWPDQAGLDVDDAVQDAFVELLRDGGGLARSDRNQGGFRAFLYGLVRNVARRHEQRRHRTRCEQPPTAFFGERPDGEARLSRVFDRAWAQGLMREAALVHSERAASPEAQRRYELLQMRFGEGMPIREIAARWQMPAETMHREYAAARREFLACLLTVLRFHDPGASTGDLARRARELASLLDVAA